jgi:endopeptidase Clp ATP-binding regulatory subunit ClpX
MSDKKEHIPDQKEIEKEIGDFLSKKFGGSVKVVTPPSLNINTQEDGTGDDIKDGSGKLNFDMYPEELVSYLDQYIIKQDQAKTILSTKICTHFNRIKYSENSKESHEILGNIKSNILMVGPTGVGKTYMIKLIAKKLGVPFVKGDATKFTETGYVGGDVEDLVRDLVREADDDIELAQKGIIYIDEIDKIASSSHLMGADISRTGVQRTLLKPMEETDVELKVPHDPISMLQEMERFQKGGSVERRVVNTGNILFIVSGAFGNITDIIKKRLSKQTIGFGSELKKEENLELLKEIRTEDLINFGFESEFVGRLPIRAIFDKLSEKDLFDILKSPNNPVLLNKKLDFAAYGIDIKFQDDALKKLAESAFQENTGARGIVSSVEQALLPFESKFPSTSVKQFPVTIEVIENPAEELERIIENHNTQAFKNAFAEVADREKKSIRDYISNNWKSLSIKYNFTLTHYRINFVVDYYCKYASNIGHAIRKISFYFKEVKEIETLFIKNHDININFEDDAIDFIIEQFIEASATSDEVYNKLTVDFKDGLRLAVEKTGRNSFNIPGSALINPTPYLNDMIKDNL